MTVDISEDERIIEDEYSNDSWYDVADDITGFFYFITLRDSKKMWYYDKEEGVYKPYADTIIDEAAQKMIYQCNIKSRSEIKATIKSIGTMIDSEELFNSTWINSTNGILDPKTFELSGHSPEYYSTTKLPFSVDFKANNLKLWKHILTIIDVKDILLIMELIWICISWQNPFKKLFIFKGERNTQKTTLSDIIVWIIGENNVSREKPQQFLAKDTRFSTSKFIGKRMNTATEIGNLTEAMIENQKALVGGEIQNAEKKGDNTAYPFDPTKFVFLYTTNTLGKIYSAINDNSIISRFQFLIFRNVIDEDKTNGLWYDTFFDNEEDRQAAIDTVVNIVIHYKKAQSLGLAPKTKWSGVADTKKILDEEMPVEDKYFKAGRLIAKNGSKVSFDKVREDFEKFVNYKINNQQMGYILKAHGIIVTPSNSIRYCMHHTLDPQSNQKLPTQFD